MTSSDTESELSKAPTNLTNPFSITTRSAVPSIPANRTRHAQTRRELISPKRPKKRSNTQATTSQASNDHTALAIVPINASEISNQDDQEMEDEEEEEFSQNSQTPGPGSSVSQAVGSFKRPRAKTSRIYKYASLRNNRFYYNHYSKSFTISGGTGAVARHLKTAHSIDPTHSSITEKRIREETAINMAILRNTKINIKTKEQRRKDLMGIGLNKTTLEYLYLQWAINYDIPFNQIRDARFRTFLEYINPATNRMLPNSDSTIKSHAEDLFNEGKKRLRHILATALSDIHLTYDIWTSPNHLRLLAIIRHFTSEKGELHTITLALKELEGEHSGENQATIILDMLNDYKIRNKLGYMVIDNIESNNTLITAVATSLNDKGVSYNTIQQRLRYNNHVINLTVQAFLFGKRVNDFKYLKNKTDSLSDTQLNQ